MSLLMDCCLWSTIILALVQVEFLLIRCIIFVVGLRAGLLSACNFGLLWLCFVIFQSFFGLLCLSLMFSNLIFLRYFSPPSYSNLSLAPMVSLLFSPSAHSYMDFSNYSSHSLSVPPSLFFSSSIFLPISRLRYILSIVLSDDL